MRPPSFVSIKYSKCQLFQVTININFASEIQQFADISYIEVTSAHSSFDVQMGFLILFMPAWFNC